MDKLIRVSDNIVRIERIIPEEVIPEQIIPARIEAEEYDLESIRTEIKSINADREVVLAQLAELEDKLQVKEFQLKTFETIDVVPVDEIITK